MKVKKIPGRITTLFAAPYKGSMVYIRRIDQDIFEWSLVFKEEIYTNYMVFTQPKGKRWTKYQIKCGMNLLVAGAQATVDSLLGEKPTEKDKAMTKDVEQLAKAVN
jgi:hypothetical protein